MKGGSKTMSIRRLRDSIIKRLYRLPKTLMFTSSFNLQDTKPNYKFDSLHSNNEPTVKEVTKNTLFTIAPHTQRSYK